MGRVCVCCCPVVPSWFVFFQLFQLFFLMQKNFLFHTALKGCYKSLIKLQEELYNMSVTMVFKLCEIMPTQLAEHTHTHKHTTAHMWLGKGLTTTTHTICYVYMGQHSGVHWSLLPSSILALPLRFSNLRACSSKRSCRQDGRGRGPG